MTIPPGYDRLVRQDPEFEPDVYKIPVYVGYWKVIDSFNVQSCTKPNCFHRFMNRLLIGWKWVDE